MLRVLAGIIPTIPMPFARVYSVAFSCALLAGCAGQLDLADELAAANHCETEADCVLIGSKCPFDCYIYVHANEADRLRTAVEEYPSNCTYSCIQSFGVECRDNKCAARLEPAPTGENVDGAPGSPCGSHADCETPMEYVIRSVCPYTSYCVEETCSVACPQMQHDIDPAVSSSGPVVCAQDADCDCSNYAPQNLERCACVDGACAALIRE